jgi:hypothetical protein
VKRRAIAVTGRALVESLRKGHYNHVVFLVGSKVSCAGQNPCADVRTIRNRLILEPLRERFDPDKAKGDEHVYRLDGLMSDPLDPLGAVVYAMPFEQFMSCLYAVSPQTALAVVQSACNTDRREDFQPNGLHCLIAKLSFGLLSKKLAKAVTVLTTNYDLGLDAALKIEARHKLPLHPGADPEKTPPAYRARDGNLGYVKVHGCITKPKSLVFTMERLAELTFNPEELQLFLEPHLGSSASGKRLVVISVGYSFSDPDLRPLWQKFFGHEATLVLRLVKDDDENKPSQKTGLQSVFKGVEFSQKQFFEALRRRREVPCNLFKPEDKLFKPEDNFLLEMAKALELRIADDCIPAYAAVPDTLVESASEAVRQLSFDDAAEFMARLCDFSARSDAIQVIDRATFGKPREDSNPWDKRTATKFYLGFSQRGHCWDMDGQRAMCRRLRKTYSAHDAKLLGFSLPSFSLTIDNPNWRKGIVAWVGLVWARWRHFASSEPESKRRFTHYQLHFRLKVRQRLVVQLEQLFRACGFLDRCLGLRSERGIERSARNFVWREILVELDKLTTDFMEAESMLDVTQVADLLVQCKVHSRAVPLKTTSQAGEADPAVIQMEQAALALNKPHNVAWVERTRGWYELSRGNDGKARLKALIRFCTAVLRGTYSPHRSEDLLQKTIPQCLRVVRSIDRRNPGPECLSFDSLSQKVSVEELRKACISMQEHVEENLKAGRTEGRETIDWEAAKKMGGFYFGHLPSNRVQSRRKLLDLSTDPACLEGDLFVLPIFPYI